MLSNAYFLAKFRFDTAENEPAKNLQNFTKNLQNLLILLTPRLLIGDGGARGGEGGQAAAHLHVAAGAGVAAAAAAPRLGGGMG